MEFVSNVEDLSTVVGEVSLSPNGRGIQMDLPPQSGDENDIHRIVYGQTKSGKRYIETVSLLLKDENPPVYGEASIPEILVFAKRAFKDLPESLYTTELRILALRLVGALNSVL